MAEFRLSNFTSGVALTAAELNTGLTYTDYTPAVTQGVAVTSTRNFARYTKFGKMIHVSVQVTCTSSGTTNNKIVVSLPVDASSNVFFMGVASVTSNACFAIYDSATTVSFSPGLNASSIIGGSLMGQSGTNVTTLVNGNVIRFNLTYEAA